MYALWPLALGLPTCNNNNNNNENSTGDSKPPEDSMHAECRILQVEAWEGYDSESSEIPHGRHLP